MQDIRDQGARRAHSGGMAISALEVARAEIGKPQRLIGADLRAADPPRPGPAVIWRANARLVSNRPWTAASSACS